MRHIGVSNFDPNQLRRAQVIAPVETLQPPYSLVDRRAEAELLPFRAGGNRGDRVLPHGLGPSLRRDDADRIACATSRRLAPAQRAVPGAPAHAESRARGAAEVAARHDTGAGAVAVAWTLRNPAVDDAITGYRRPDQVDRLWWRRAFSSMTTTSPRSTRGPEMAATQSPKDRLRRARAHGWHYGRPVPRRQVRGPRRGADSVACTARAGAAVASRRPTDSPQTDSPQDVLRAPAANYLEDSLRVRRSADLGELRRDPPRSSERPLHARRRIGPDPLSR